jgi:hypothetical protein
LGFSAFGRYPYRMFLGRSPVGLALGGGAVDPSFTTLARPGFESLHRGLRFCDGLWCSLLDRGPLDDRAFGGGPFGCGRLLTYGALGVGSLRRRSLRRGSLGRRSRGLLAGVGRPLRGGAFAGRPTTDRATALRPFVASVVVRAARRRPPDRRPHRLGYGRASYRRGVVVVLRFIVRTLVAGVVERAVLGRRRLGPREPDP